MLSAGSKYIICFDPAVEVIFEKIRSKLNNFIVHL